MTDNDAVIAADSSVGEDVEPDAGVTDAACIGRVAGKGTGTIHVR